MLFYYIRHGKPTYNPDELTPLGHQQAEAVGRRLAGSGIEKVFASTSNRAMQTAAPLCRLTDKELTTLAFANEHTLYHELSVPLNETRDEWPFHVPKYRALFQSEEVRAMDSRWYEYPELSIFAKGWHRIATESEAFFKTLGYERIEGSSAFRVVAPPYEKVAFFAHQGFGLMFFSWLMNIPYPIFSTQFDIFHTGMCVVDFKEENGICYPCICAFSETGHLHYEQIPKEFEY